MLLNPVTLVKKMLETGKITWQIALIFAWLGVKWQWLKNCLPSQQFSPQKLLPCWNSSQVASVISLSILKYKLQQLRKQFTTCSASLASEAVTLRRRGQVNVVAVPVNLQSNLSPQTSGVVFLCILCPFFSFPFLSSPSPVPP